MSIDEVRYGVVLPRNAQINHRKLQIHVFSRLNIFCPQKSMLLKVISLGFESQ